VATSLDAAGERGLIARGCGRSYGDTSTNDRGHVIDMTALDAIESFDPDSGSIVCQAGVTMAMLVDRYLADGFVPPVCPGTGYVTIGGSVANDVHGKNHCTDGSFGDYVDWIELLLPTGELRRVTAEDRELFRATIGGIGLTGLITRVGFRMSRIGTNAVRVEERRIKGLEEFFEALETSIQAHKYSVGWVDALARGRHLGRGILMNADPAPEFMTVKPRRPITVPFDLPPAAMSRPSMVLFNALYRNRVRGSRTVDVDFRRFVFPLDALLEWNRLYGKAGAVQFQCLVPPDQARPAFRKILTLASESAVASPLAVIKSTGREGRGMLSFGRPGFSLALDFPRRPSTDALIPQLHAITIEHGGRLYLAKDACLTPAELSRMYPEAEQFKALIRKIDPESIMQSDMARRLGLIGREGVS
jgi:decaprenylphospho-beta-D-ribofuranose 2-oxidase